MKKINKQTIYEGFDNRKYGNINIKINAKRICREVLDNMLVQWDLNRHEKEIICQAVTTTIWEIFERKEERLKEELRFKKDKSDYKWEFKK